MQINCQDPNGLDISEWICKFFQNSFNLHLGTLNKYRVLY